MKTKRLLGIFAALAMASMSAVSVNAQITNGNTPNEWMGEVTMQEKVNLYALVPEGFDVSDAAYLAIQLTSFDKSECGGIVFYNSETGGWDNNGGANYEWAYGGGKMFNVEDDGWCYISIPEGKFKDAGGWAEIWFQHWGGPDIQIDEAGMKLLDANKKPLGAVEEQPAETQATEAQQTQAATQQAAQQATKQNTVAAKAANNSNPSTGQKENAAALIVTALAAAATVGATFKKRK